MQRVVASKLLNRRVDVLIVWTWKWCSTVRPPRVLFFFSFFFESFCLNGRRCVRVRVIFLRQSALKRCGWKKKPRGSASERGITRLCNQTLSTKRRTFPVRRPLWAFQPLTLFFFLKRESTKLFYFYSTICKLEMKRQVKSTELSTILTLSFKVFWQQNAKFTKLMKWGHSTASIIRLTKWKQVCAASDAVGTGNWRKRIYNWDIIRQA